MRRTKVLVLAAGQFGLFTTVQALEAGMTREAVKAWARTGSIAKVRPGVWSVSGVPESPEREAMQQILGVRGRAALAVTSAGWVWAIPGHRLHPVEVMSRRSERHIPVARAHTSTRLGESDVTVRRGLPVTTPTRTIFDLAGRQAPGRTARDLNHLMGRGLVTLSGLNEHLDRLAGRGRPGITVMRERIAAIAAGEQPTESALELRCREILHWAGFTGLDQQVVLGDDDGVIGRVDFCDRRLRVVIEVDSDRYHGGLLDRQLDAARTARLEATGWTVVRITEHEIFWQRDSLVERLIRIRVTARVRLDVREGR